MTFDQSDFPATIKMTIYTTAKSGYLDLTVDLDMFSVPFELRRLN